MTAKIGVGDTVAFTRNFIDSTVPVYRLGSTYAAASWRARVTAIVAGGILAQLDDGSTYNLGCLCKPMSIEFIEAVGREFVPLFH